MDAVAIPCVLANRKQFVSHERSGDTLCLSQGPICISWTQWRCPVSQPTGTNSSLMDAVAMPCVPANRNQFVSHGGSGDTLCPSQQGPICLSWTQWRYPVSQPTGTNSSLMDAVAIPESQPPGTNPFLMDAVAIPCVPANTNQSVSHGRSGDTLCPSHQEPIRFSWTQWRYPVSQPTATNSSLIDAVAIPVSQPTGTNSSLIDAVVIPVSQPTGTNSSLMDAVAIPVSQPTGTNSSLMDAVEIPCVPANRNQSASHGRIGVTLCPSHQEPIRFSWTQWRYLCPSQQEPIHGLCPSQQEPIRRS
jgi:hypothetical protein